MSLDTMKVFEKISTFFINNDERLCCDPMVQSQ